MTEPVKPITVEFAIPFEKQLRALAKKYRHVRDDVEPVIKQLQDGELLGDQVPRVGYPIFKVRVKNRDIKKGKSAGYRVIYYLKTSSHIILLAIYSKLEQSDISVKEIRQIIAGFQP